MNDVHSCLTFVMLIEQSGIGHCLDSVLSILTMKEQIRLRPTFSKLLRIILERFLIFGQSVTVFQKTLTGYNFALLTNSQFNIRVT